MKEPEAFTWPQAISAVLLAPIYVPAFVICRPGDAWAILRALILICWEFVTTGKVDGWE